MHSSVQIKDIGNSFGVYANKSIKKGSLVFEISTENINETPSKYSVQIGLNKHVEPITDEISKKQPEFFWRFLNHSCEPNCVCNIDNMSFDAIKDIDSGEQLTFNYLTTEIDMSTPFKCACNSVKCYGEIKGFKHLSNIEKKSLYPIVSPHIKLLFKINEN